MHFLVLPPVLDLSSLVNDIRGGAAIRALLLLLLPVVVLVISVAVTGFLSSVTGFFSSTVPLLSLLDRLNRRVTAVAARERRIPIVGFLLVFSIGGCCSSGSGSTDFSGSGRSIFSGVCVLSVLGLIVVVEEVEVAYL